MGNIQILTARQKKVLSFVKENPYLTDRFYFTGGTALSYYYLHHRLSEDLDFFSEKEFRVKYEPFLLSCDLLAFEHITDLPNMLKPLLLSDLKSYFREKAVELAKKSVKP